MNMIFYLLLAALLLVPPSSVRAAAPGRAPQWPLTGKRIVRVSTEPQLQRALDELRDGDTILLADGTYPLTSSLYIRGRADVTIRGMDGCTNVILQGKGMDNRQHQDVLFGIWSNSPRTTVAHLSIRDTYDNLLIFNPGATAPHVYCVQLLNAGSQFIKANPTDANAGTGVDHGLVEFCWFEYTGGPPADHGSGAGYFNAISAHAAHHWTVRFNLFRNLHNPDTASYLWNPAVLFWRHSADNVTEQNIFINVDRAVAYGLDDRTPYFDHAGGAVRNNFVFLAPGLLSPKRRASSDGAIIAWNSPGTQIDHNTLLLNGNEFFAVEFRFSTTAGGAARHNLADAPVHLRDEATALLSSNSSSATPALFLNAAEGDLHLRASARTAIAQVPTLTSVTNDIDGDLRPLGGLTAIGADSR